MIGHRHLIGYPVHQHQSALFSNYTGIFSPLLGIQDLQLHHVVTHLELEYAH